MNIVLTMAAKTMLMVATLAVALSLAVSHATAAEDRESHALRLFDVSQVIQQSGPCRGLDFLWLTNPKMISFLDSLLDGAYDNDGARLPEYIACFEHQRSFVRIRTVIHAEFPGTEAAFKVADEGYFTDADIDEFIWLLEGTVKPAAGSAGKTPDAGLDIPPPPRIRPAALALVGARTSTDRTLEGANGASTRNSEISASLSVAASSPRGGGAQDDTLASRIARLKPSPPTSPSEEVVAALLRSLEREIDPLATLAPIDPLATLAPNGGGVRQSTLRERQSRMNITPAAAPPVRETSTLAQRLQRTSQLPSTDPALRRRLFVPSSAEYPRTTVEYSRTTVGGTGTDSLILVAGDQIKITVFGEENLSGEFKVGATGQLSLPLIGRVAAAGGSADQLEAFIVTALRSGGYVKTPRVNVEILSLRPIFILGEINRPGSYPYSAGLTVLKAVALAGGFTYRARKRVLFVTRDPQQGERKISVEGLLLPGDTIRVSERWF